MMSSEVAAGGNIVIMFLSSVTIYIIDNDHLKLYNFNTISFSASNDAKFFNCVKSGKLSFKHLETRK